MLDMSEMRCQSWSRAKAASESPGLVSPRARNNGRSLNHACIRRTTTHQLGVRFIRCLLCRRGLGFSLGYCDQMYSVTELYVQAAIVMESKSTCDETERLPTKWTLTKRDGTRVRSKRRSRRGFLFAYCMINTLYIHLVCNCN